MADASHVPSRRYATIATRAGTQGNHPDSAQEGPSATDERRSIRVLVSSIGQVINDSLHCLQMLERKPLPDRDPQPSSLQLTVLKAMDRMHYKSSLSSCSQLIDISLHLLEFGFSSRDEVAYV